MQVLASCHAARIPGRRIGRRRLSEGLAKQTVELFIGASRAETYAGAGQRLKNLFFFFFILICSRTHYFSPNTHPCYMRTQRVHVGIHIIPIGRRGVRVRFFFQIMYALLGDYINYTG